jgi:hypothetical protein
MTPQTDHHSSSMSSPQGAGHGYRRLFLLARRPAEEGDCRPFVTISAARIRSHCKGSIRLISAAELEAGGLYLMKVVDPCGGVVHPVHQFHGPSPWSFQ